MSVKRMFAAGLLVLGAGWACGRVEPLGSRYVKSQTVYAAEGAVLHVSEAEEPALAGTELSIPPNALAKDTVITLELGTEDLAANPAGPVAVWGPSGTAFSTPGEMTLPFKLPAGAQPHQLAVAVRESSGAQHLIPNDQLAVNAQTRRVRFPVHHFTSFQPVVNLVQCLSNADCGSAQVCVNGACQAPADAGAVCMGDADCAMGEECINGACHPVQWHDAGYICSAMSPCPTGYACVNGACQPQSSACMSTADCPMGQHCQNGTCHSQGGSDAGPIVCMTTMDCAVGEACINGVCQPQGQVCMVDADCPMGEHCVSGVCHPLSGTDAGTSDAGLPQTCQTHADCPMGQCANGMCFY